MTPCAHCGKPTQQRSGAINRARKIGAPIYCDRTCSGLARRTHKTEAQRKAEKQAYDARRRIELADQIKAAKRARHKATYDPAKAAIERKKRMHLHVEYCRRPEYREYKRQYDQRYQMESQFGPFWEAARVLLDLEQEIRTRATHYEIAVQNDTVNKTMKRKRHYAKTTNDQSRPGQVLSGKGRSAQRDQPENRALGDA